MKKQYTLLESGVILAGIPFALVLFTVGVGVPMGLMTAWMRSVAWNWFMPTYFHLPVIGVWLMFAIGCVLSLFRASSPSLKSEMYASGVWTRLFTEILGAWLMFGVAWGIHHWILTGAAR